MTLRDTDDPAIMEELGNLLLDIRKSLGVVGEIEIIPYSPLFKDPQQDIDKENFVLHRCLSIRFKMGNADCIVGNESAIMQF